MVRVTAALGVLLLLGCYSRSVRPDGTVCTSYHPDCLGSSEYETCQTDGNGCEQCTCTGARAQDHLEQELLNGGPPRGR